MVVLGIKHALTGRRLARTDAASELGAHAEQESISSSFPHAALDLLIERLRQEHPGRWTEEALALTPVLAPEPLLHDTTALVGALDALESLRAVLDGGAPSEGRRTWQSGIRSSAPRRGT